MSCVLPSQTVFTCSIIESCPGQEKRFAARMDSMIDLINEMAGAG